MTNLLEYIQNNKYSELEKLIDSKVDINQTFSKYYFAPDEPTTLLNEAINNNNTKITELLLNKKADINNNDNSSYSPLKLALILNKNPDIINLLLKYNPIIDDEFVILSNNYIKTHSNIKNKLIGGMEDGTVSDSEDILLLDGIVSDRENIKKYKNYKDFKRKVLFNCERSSKYEYTKLFTSDSLYNELTWLSYTSNKKYSFYYNTQTNTTLKNIETELKNVLNNTLPKDSTYNYNHISLCVISLGFPNTINSESHNPDDWYNSAYTEQILESETDHFIFNFIEPQEDPDGYQRIMKSKTLPRHVPGFPRPLPDPDYYVEKPKPLESYLVPQTPEHSSSSSMGPSAVIPESPIGSDVSDVIPGSPMGSDVSDVIPGSP